MAHIPAAEWGLEQCAIYAKNPTLCNKADIWKLLFTVKEIAERHQVAVTQCKEEVDKHVTLFLATKVFETVKENALHYTIEDNTPPLTNESVCFIVGVLRKIFHIQQVIGYLVNEICVMS